MLRRILIILLLLSCKCWAQDTVNKRQVLLPLTEIQKSKKLKEIVFSSFERKVHISLNPYHDKYYCSAPDLDRKPTSFIATEFQYNEIESLYINKIEGRLPPFDSTMVTAKVLVIQRNKTLRIFPLFPFMIKKGQFELNVDYLRIEPGEFYLLYTFDFLKAGRVEITVNPKWDGKDFDFGSRKNDNKRRALTKLNLSVPAPQFKVYCTQE